MKGHCAQCVRDRVLVDKVRVRDNDDADRVVVYGFICEPCQVYFDTGDQYAMEFIASTVFDG